MKLNRPGRGTASLALIVLSLSQSLHGAAGSWATTTGGLWSDPANWTGSTIADGATFTATFSQNLAAPATVILDSPRILGGLAFTDTAAPFFNWVLDNNSNPANSLTLTPAAGIPAIDVGASTVATVGTVLSGTNGIAKTGTGTLNLTAANTFTGIVQVAGVLNVASVSDYGTPSAIGARTAVQESATGENIAIQLRGGTLQYTGSTNQSTNRQIRLNNTTTNTIESSGAGTLSFTFAGAPTNLYENAGTRTLNLTGTNTGANTFAIALNNQSTNATSLTKSGSGTWNYSGVGNYTGATTVSAGKLILSGNRTAAAGGITVANLAATNATLDITAGNFSVNGFTIGTGAGTTGTINQSAGSITVTGNQLLVGNGTAIGNYNLSGGTLTGSAAGTRGIILGVNTGTSATFTMTGGTLAMGSSNLQLGRSENSLATTATGTFSQSAGTAAVGTLGIGGAFGANNAGNIGNLTLTGGTFSANNINGLAGGNNSTANISISGTAQATLPAFPLTRGTGAVAHLTIDGGTIIPTAASAVYLGGLTTATINSGGAKFDIPSGRDIVVAQSFSGSGGLSKLGVGSMTLTSAQTYIGTTNVNAGTLIGSGFASNVNVAPVSAFGGTGNLGTLTTSAASVLFPGGPATIGTLSPTTLNLVADSLIHYELGVSSDLIDITANNGLNIGGGIINLYAAGGATPLTDNGTYTLFDYSLGYTGSLANLIIGNAQPAKFYSITDDTLNTIVELTVSDAVVSQWNGSGDGVNWSDNLNWVNNISPNSLGAVALFTGTGTTVTVDGAKTVGNLNFDSASSFTINGSAITLDNGVASSVITTLSGNHTINSPLTLATPLNITPSVGTSVKLGGNITSLENIAVTAPGSAELAGTNTFANLAVSDGTAILSGSSTFDLLAVSGGAAIITGASNHLATEIVNGSVTVGDGGTSGDLGLGPVNISGNESLIFNRSDDFTISNNLLGAGAQVTKLGAGILTLNGTNTIATGTGSGINLNEGTLRIGNAAALPTSVVIGVNTGGILDLNGFDANSGYFNGTGGTVTDNSAGSGTSVLTLSQTTNTTFSGQFSDGATRLVGVNKTGIANLTLSGSSPSTSTGGFTIGEGTLTLAKTPGVNALSGPITIGDTISGDVLQLGDTNQLADSAVLTFNSGGNNNSAFFRLKGFNETIRGIQTTTPGAAVIENEGAAGVATLTIDTAGADFTYDGIMRDRSTAAAGTFAVIKTGAGTLTLANTLTVAASTHAGGTTVDGGKLVLSDILSHASPLINNLSAADLVIHQTTRTGTISSVISGPGGITKNGPAAISLSNGLNTFTGGIDFNEGTILLTGNGPLGNAAGQFTCVGPAVNTNVITVENGCILAINNTAPLGNSGLLPEFAPSLVINPGGKLTGNGFVAFVPNLTLNGGMVEIGNGNTTGSFNTNLGLVGTVVVSGSTPSSIVTTGTGGNANASLGVRADLAGTTFQVANVTSDSAPDLTISSNLRNAASNPSPLTKTGPGTLLLTGANTYSGGTSVDNGTLNVSNATGSGTGTGTVIVASGANLIGTGSIGGGLSVDGTVNPGVTTLGTLTVTGNVTFNSGGVLAVAIDDTSTPKKDLLAISGTLTATSATLDFDVTGTLADPVYVVATYTGAPPTGFTATGVPAGYSVDYGYNGNSIALVNSYLGWAVDSGLTVGVNDGKNDDPDFDGVPNVLEFATNGNPLSGAANPLVRAEIVDVDPTAGVTEALAITLPVRTGGVFNGPGDLVSLPVDGIVYRIQATADLADFTTATVTEVIDNAAIITALGLPPANAGWTYRTFQAPGLPGTTTREFIRASAE